MRDLASLVLGSLVFQFNNDADDGENAQVIASHTADCLSALIDVMKGSSLQPAPREIRDAAQVRDFFPVGLCLNPAFIQFFL
jgi:hypothetical protein